MYNMILDRIFVLVVDCTHLIEMYLYIDYIITILLEFLEFVDCSIYSLFK